MRPRKKDRHLPPCVYLRHGQHWFVQAGKWTALGAELGPALHAYARIVATPTHGMPALISAAEETILAGRSAATQKKYRLSLARLSEVFRDFRPEQVKHADVADLMLHFRSSASTANHTLTVLRLVFRYALDHRLVEADPTASVQRAKQQARTRLITPEEYAAVSERGSERLRVIMRLCYLTGQRIGDVLSINRADLQADGIYFKPQKTERSGKHLIIGWTPELRAAVDAARALSSTVISPLLLCSRQGEPLAHQNIWREFKRAAKLAGVTDVTLHDLRALSATDAEAQGLDATQLLAHGSSRTTESYLRDKRARVVSGPSFGRPIDGPKKVVAKQQLK
jgi:integrase